MFSIWTKGMFEALYLTPGETAMLTSLSLSVSHPQRIGSTAYLQRATPSLSASMRSPLWSLSPSILSIHDRTSFAAAGGVPV